MTRPPISPDRMLGEASNARVIYRSDAVHPRHQANNGGRIHFCHLTT